MDKMMQEDVILALIDAYPHALLLPSGVIKRTPLHIAFTDYKFYGLIQPMIQRGKEATAMRDTNGSLPILPCHLLPLQRQVRIQTINSFRLYNGLYRTKKKWIWHYAQHL